MGSQAASLWTTLYEREQTERPAGGDRRRLHERLTNLLAWAGLRQDG
jgi:hypothetical protein